MTGSLLLRHSYENRHPPSRKPTPPPWIPAKAGMTVGMPSHFHLRMWPGGPWGIIMKIYLLPPLRGRIEVGGRFPQPAYHPRPNLPPSKGEGTIEAGAARHFHPLMWPARAMGDSGVGRNPGAVLWVTSQRLRCYGVLDSRFRGNDGMGAGYIHGNYPCPLRAT